MKCPRCGHWNKPNFPHCFQCGEPLNAQAEPGWREQFERPQKTKERVVFDDTTEPVEDIAEVTPKRRPRKDDDQNLAEEMTRLKDRRARGSVYLQEMRERAAEEGIAPSGSGVSIRRTGGFFTDVPDNPEETVQVPTDIRSKRRSGQPERSGYEYEIEAETIVPPPEKRKGWGGRKAPAPSPRTVYDNPYAEYDIDLPPELDAPGRLMPEKRRKSRRFRLSGPMLIAYLLVGILVAAVLAFGVYMVVSYVMPTIATRRAAPEALDNYTLEVVEVGGYPGHRLTITAEEGTQVIIAELLTRASVVVDGKAVIDIPDYTFYNHIEPLDASMETMDVTLTPTLHHGGVDTRMEPIKYTIDIPASPLELVQPEIPELEVHSSFYSIVLNVAPGSTVFVNGESYSDTVSDSGQVTIPKNVQAIGNNVFGITVKAPYCRETNMNVVLYRAKMDIPLELSPTTLNTVSDTDLTIRGTTDKDATVTVDTPYFSIDTSTLAVDGTFVVSAKMTRVGYNTIVIRASMEGKEDSIVEHTVYHLPGIAEYSKRAWKFGRAEYNELINNLTMRVEEARIYKCVGVIKEILSSNPQLAIMDTSEDGREQLALLENGTTSKNANTVWEVGKKYIVYADAAGIYNTMPRLVGRYSSLVTEE